MTADTCRVVFSHHSARAWHVFAQLRRIDPAVKVTRIAEGYLAEFAPAKIGDVQALLARFPEPTP